MSGPLVPARRRDISEVELDGEVVLLDHVSGALHVLNPVAAAIWSELDGERTLEEIVARLSEATGSENSRVRADVSGFLDELRSGGLLA